MQPAAFPPDPFAIAREEPRPRDFSARFVRQARGIGRRPAATAGRGRLGLAALAAAVALPAIAQSGGWDRFEIADAVTQGVVLEPMPFERAGSSFPGSAFYYLDSDSLGSGGAVASSAGAFPGDRDAALAMARPLRIDRSGIDRTRALQCLTAAIYYEAASEPDAGQRAVAQVVLNRVAHPAYPATVCGVVYQGSERPTGCQFSFTCDGSLARRPAALFWNRAEAVARQALAGQVYAPVGLATHYHTMQVHPGWADSLRYLATIGAHRFYSFTGAAGRPGTFRFAYLGGEPVAAPHPRDASAAALAAAAALDPVALQNGFAGGASAALAPNSPSIPPLYTPYTPEIRARGGDAVYRARNLPETTGIRPEFENSGRWIAQPGH